MTALIPPQHEEIRTRERIMKSTYRILAYVIAGLVVVQAALIVYSFSALDKYISDGATITPAIWNATNASFPGTVGFALHWFDGVMFIPVVTLILVVVSFFAKIPGGVKWALSILGLLILQIVLGFVAHAVPGISWLHGVNAFVMFVVAVLAGRRVPQTQSDTTVTVAT
jgi:hypothetical protein